jgi:hypothetical protein
VATRALLSAALVWSLVGCEPDARNDANLFLDRVDRIDADDPLAQREALVESLATLPLASPEVKNARTSCVDAHRAMIYAEQENELVRDALMEVRGDESRLTPHQRAKIERHLTESTRYIERSRPLLDTCHRLRNQLRTRYAPGHRTLDD